MSGTVLVPVHLAARVVTAASVQAPAFRGQTPQPLEKGVHVHWALPDALTRASVEERGGGRRLVYPAVPDLWLVARFAPEAPARRVARPVGPVVARPAKPVVVGPVVKGPVVAGPIVGVPLLSDRAWRGWVIESRTRRRVDLASWTPPADYATTHVLTAAGVLPVADGRPGWGAYPEGDESVHPAAHAYYPTSRNLFGFHDPLDDLQGRDGVVTYVAIGWYRHAAHDPVHRTFASEALLDRWKLDWRPRSSPMHHDFSPSLAGSASGIGELSGVRAVTAVRTAPALRRVAEAATRVRPDVAELVRAINGADVSGRVVDVPVGQLVKKGPDALVCHGALLEVDLTPSARASTKGSWKVSVVSSLQRALAEVAGGGGDDAWKATLQAMILDADQKSSTMAGLIGMPNEVHAQTFQGRHSKSAHHAQLDIHPPARRAAVQAAPAAGNWPKKMIARHVSEVSAIELRPWLPPAAKPKAAPPEPTAAELAAFTQQVAQAMATLAADGKPAVHSRFVRVVDHRSEPPVFAARTGPSSPSGRTFWVDREDPAAMRELLILTSGARVALPTRATVWQQPGPRWYRPWSPHLVMMNTGRSYRYGFDGRFDTHGLVRCRVNGYTLSSINSSFGGKTPDPVTGTELLGQTAALGKAGLPAIARSVLEEAMLLDPSNAKEIARAWLRNWKRDFAGVTAPSAAAAEKQIRQQLTSNLLLRDPSLSDDELIAFSDAQQFTGEDPSELSFMPWQQAWEPLFANIKYTFQPAAAGALGPVDAAIGAAQGAPIQGQEQQLLGAAVSKVLDSAIVSKLVIDPTGHLIPASSPKGLDSDDFLRLDVLSTALTGFDDKVFAAGVRMRAGTLRIDQIEVVGETGVAETITAPAPLPATSGWQTPLQPRLPSWSRVQLRLMSAHAPDAEADFAQSPVCGFLVPDLLEHTLEVYDADGRALGQLASDAPAVHTADTLVGTAPNATPKTPPPAVRYEPHPWRPGAPLDAASPYLKLFVDGVCNAVRAERNPRAGTLHESALTAMLRVIDTVRSTVDPADKHGERTVRMLGNPIAIVRARLWVERTGASDVSGDPPLLADPLTVAVKIGTATQPDDGVLGCFMPATSPGGADARFRPVDAAALEDTLVNALADAVPGVGGIDACHTFVHDPAGADTTFPVTTGELRDLLLLVDLNGGIYATSGVLPRKWIAMPKEFIEGALRNLEPSFRVGPLLSASEGNVVLPAPQIPGYECEWVERGDADGEGAPISPLPPDGVLPAARVSLTEGWLNLVHPDAG